MLSRWYRARKGDIGIFSIAAASTLIFIVWAKTELTGGHNWGDDFGLYLQLADNILNERPYNHLNTLIQVPPGFPLLLAGWANAFGWSFVSLKALNIVAWIAAAWISFAFAWTALGKTPALYVLLAHFVLPSYYAQQQAVLSDPSFVAFVDLTLFCCFLYLRALRRDQRANVLLLATVIAGLFCALLIRPAALPLAMAVAVAPFLQWLQLQKQLARHTMLAAAALVTVAIYLFFFGSSSSSHAANALAKLITPGESLMSSLATMALGRVLDELRNLNVLVGWYPTGPYAAMSALLTGAFGGASYLRRTKDFVVPLFAACYLAVLLVTPWNQGFRYLLPLVFVLLLFSASLLVWVLDVLRGRGKTTSSLKVVALAGAALLVISLAVQLLGVWKVRGYDDDETADERTRALITWVRTNTLRDDRLCTFKPRAIMFFTSRETCYIPEDRDVDVGALLAAQGASYAVLITRPAYPYYQAIDDRLRLGSNGIEVFRNADYVVYRFRAS